MSEIDNPFVGKWTYRSLLNDPDIRTVSMISSLAAQSS
jgi:hypothetical protein